MSLFDAMNRCRWEADLAQRLGNRRRAAMLETFADSLLTIIEEEAINATQEADPQADPKADPKRARRRGHP